MENLGKRIYDARISQGLSLEAVGQYVGVGKSTVRKWENGMIKNMRRDKIKKLSEVLHVSPGYLMGWTNDPSDYGDEQESKDDGLTEIQRRYLSVIEKLSPAQQQEGLKYLVFLEKTQDL